MKVIGYFIYGKPYCLTCVEEFDLDVEEDEMEPIFSGDFYPYDIICDECEESILSGDGEGEEDLLEGEEETIEGSFEIIEEEDGDGEGEEEEEELNLTCSICSLSDFCPYAFNEGNRNGNCIPGFFHDLEEEGEEDE